MDYNKTTEKILSDNDRSQNKIIHESVSHLHGLFKHIGIKMDQTIIGECIRRGIKRTNNVNLISEKWNNISNKSVDDMLLEAPGERKIKPTKNKDVRAQAEEIRAKKAQQEKEKQALASKHNNKADAAYTPQPKKQPEANVPDYDVNDADYGVKSEPEPETDDASSDVDSPAENENTNEKQKDEKLKRTITAEIDRLMNQLNISDEGIKNSIINDVIGRIQETETGYFSSDKERESNYWSGKEKEKEVEEYESDLDDDERNKKTPQHTIPKDSGYGAAVNEYHKTISDLANSGKESDELLQDEINNAAIDAAEFTIKYLKALPDDELFPNPKFAKRKDIILNAIHDELVDMMLHEINNISNQS